MSTKSSKIRSRTSHVETNIQDQRNGGPMEVAPIAVTGPKERQVPGGRENSAEPKMLSRKVLHDHRRSRHPGTRGVAPVGMSEAPGTPVPLDDDRSLTSKTIALVRFRFQLPLRDQRDSYRSNTKRRGKRVPYKEPRGLCMARTHILSLPPTARLVSGVSTPARPLPPRSTILRR